MHLLVIQRLFLEAALDILYFPLWWYTGGAKHAGAWCLGLFQRGNATLAPGLWLKNIFVPMYGQYDWEGKIISFFMRSVQVVVRSVALLFWLVACLLLLGLWLFIPVAIIYGVVASI